MKHLLISLLLFALSATCSADDATVVSSVITFKATVLDPETPYNGRVIPVHFDPMFPLIVKILSSDSQLPEFAAGCMVKFAIHSPTQLFGRDEPIGTTFTFSVVREAKGEKQRFSLLTVASTEPNKASEPTATIPPPSATIPAPLAHL